MKRKTYTRGLCLILFSVLSMAHADNKQNENRTVFEMNEPKVGDICLVLGSPVESEMRGSLILGKIQGYSLYEIKTDKNQYSVDLELQKKALRINYNRLEEDGIHASSMSLGKGKFDYDEVKKVNMSIVLTDELTQWVYGLQSYEAYLLTKKGSSSKYVVFQLRDKEAVNLMKAFPCRYFTAWYRADYAAAAEEYFSKKYPLEPTIQEARVGER